MLNLVVHKITAGLKGQHSYFRHFRLGKCTYDFGQYKASGLCVFVHCGSLRNLTVMQQSCCPFAGCMLPILAVFSACHPQREGVQHTCRDFELSHLPATQRHTAGVQLEQHRCEHLKPCSLVSPHSSQDSQRCLFMYIASSGI
jgi:hypothetical protein